MYMYCMENALNAYVVLVPPFILRKNIENL